MTYMSLRVTFYLNAHVGERCGALTLNQSSRKRRGRGGEEKKEEEEKESNDTWNWALVSTFPTDLREASL